LARTPDGREIVKVLDFGVSKLKDGARWEAQPTLTSGDGPLGSPQFISPEQLVDSRAVDERSDLWSLGVVMFRLLAGSYPFVGNNIAETFSAVLNAPIPRLSELDVEVPEAFERLLDRCLRRNVAERLASARELAEALGPFAGPASAVGDGLRGVSEASEASWREARVTSPDPESPTMTTPSERVASDPDFVRTGSGVPPSLSRRRPPAVDSPLRPTRWMRWALVGVGGALVLATAKIVTSVHARASGPAPSGEPPDDPPMASSGELVELSDVELSLVAPQPIVAVRAAGLRRLTIDGTTATLAV
jgi:serine/threonine-protein kinase